MKFVYQRETGVSLAQFWRGRPRRYLRIMPAGGGGKDPAMTDAHRRLKGPLRVARGVMNIQGREVLSYVEHDRRTRERLAITRSLRT